MQIELPGQCRGSAHVRLVFIPPLRILPLIYPAGTLAQVTALAPGGAIGGCSQRSIAETLNEILHDAGGALRTPNLPITVYVPPEGVFRAIANAICEW